jgi:UDP-N-acetylglucosamine--N-acetylmuramyl-(pentapeptide) pyrophosphoryl-undecaprenol N-acetylglucosamine transferase
LAVVDALGKRAEVLWAGGEGGMAESLVTRAGIAYRGIPAAGVHGVSLRRLPGNLSQLMRGVLVSRSILAEFRPEVIFFTGGYVGVPMALAGWGFPKVILVPDVEPALAAKFIARLSRRVLLSTEQSRQYYPRDERTYVSGYPTRPDLREADRAGARESFGLVADMPVLLVMGGSQGALSINRAIWAGLERLLDRFQVLHLTGDAHWLEAERIQAALSDALVDRYRPFSYLHEEMGHAFAAADLVVSRAGASVLGEYPLFGLPAVLVPYPHAWRYQRTNADYLVSRGAAVMIRDEQLHSELVPTIERLMQDVSHLKSMSEAAADLARPQAAERIADHLFAIAEGGEGGQDG